MISIMTAGCLTEAMAREVTDSVDVSNGETVNVAFGQADKRDLMGAVSTVNVAELLEKDYHTGATDDLNAIIGGYSGTIWGQWPLIIIDGIPRNVADVNATMVETVTVLKGASAVALYGSRGAKGAIIITTKRGKVSRMHIDVRANVGLKVPKAFPKYLDAASYMALYNEACRNDGINERYDATTIYQTARHSNPYRYPDLDLYSSDYLRKFTTTADATGEVYGGSKSTQYYVNFGMNYANELVKLGEADKNNTKNFYVRTNVNMRITDWLKAQVNAAVNVQDRYWGRDDFWNTASTLRPNWFAPLLPIDQMDQNNSAIRDIISTSSHIIDGKYLLGGTSTDLSNNLATTMAAGYVKYRTRNFMFDVNIGADLSMLLKGLSFKTVFGVDYENYYSEAYKVDYAVYEPTWSNVNGRDMITSLKKYNEDTASSNEYLGDSKYRQTITFSAQFDYNRTFNDSHNVSATLLGWGYQTQQSTDANHGSSDYHRTSNVNLGLRAAYNYQHRYYFDFTGAMVHSAKLPEGNRNALSPTVALGWRVSQEKWFAENVAFVDDLKLTASFANLHEDLDINNYYLYQGYYDTKGGWYQWHDSSAGGYTASQKLGSNPNLTFVTRKEMRFGLEASLFDRLLTIDANYFRYVMDGGLATGNNTVYPSWFSYSNVNFLPNINFNKDRYSGFDFTVNLHKKVGQVDASLGLAGMYCTAEATKRDEVYSDKYQYRVGNPLNSQWGYVCEGFFDSQADIAAHAQQTFGSVKPGDLKYKDVNGDNVVDSRDQVNLGRGTSPFTYGINLTLKWKDFTLFVAGTGQTGAKGFKNSDYYWVRGSRKYSEVVMGRWTEDTKATATFPRLSTTDNSNNFRNSTFWLYSTDRFDLNKVQITYDLGKSMFKPGMLVKGLIVYVSGESLLTIAKERKHMERNIGGAPYTRNFNIGLKAQF